MFSGGIGERSVELRAAIGERCACLGASVNQEANEAVVAAQSSTVMIGDGKVKAIVCRTDEQVNDRSCSTSCTLLT